MFAVLHSDINSIKSGLLHLTSQPYCKKSRLAKVKDGVINLILRNYLGDQYVGSYPGSQVGPNLIASLSKLYLSKYNVCVCVIRWSTNISNLVLSLPVRL
jgi:hypothetical protein